MTDDFDKWTNKRLNRLLEDQGIQVPDGTRREELLACVRQLMKDTDGLTLHPEEKE